MLSSSTQQAEQPAQWVARTKDSVYTRIEIFRLEHYLLWSKTLRSEQHAKGLRKERGGRRGEEPRGSLHAASQCYPGKQQGHYCEPGTDHEAGHPKGTASWRAKPQRAHKASPLYRDFERLG